MLQCVPPGQYPVRQQLRGSARTSPAVRSRPPTAPAATSAPSPSRPRNPRRDRLTRVASVSAAWLIFSSMADLLRIGNGRRLFGLAALRRIGTGFGVADPLSDARSGQHVTNVLAAVDDALRGDDTLLVDQEG